MLQQCQHGVQEGDFTFSYSQKIPEGEQETLAHGILKGASEELSHGSRETLSTQRYCDSGWETVDICAVNTRPVHSSREELSLKSLGREKTAFI